jgi:hypothetical protein
MKESQRRRWRRVGGRESSDPGYRGEACQPLDLDLVDLEVKGHFHIRKVQPEV